MKKRALLPLLVLTIFALPAFAIIVISDDEKANLAIPPDGSPWRYVARLDNKFGARATGVYLGSRYVLTANHVDKDISVVHLNDTNYTVDESFTQVALKGTDMRVLRITADPALPPLPLIGLADSEFNKPCTMIGYGLGKGAPVPGQGWKWGDDSTRVKRWATSITGSAYHNDPQSHIIYVSTTFDIAAGPNTGQIARGDSGCGLFVSIGGVWKLVGIGGYVDTDDQALYDKDPATPGNQPDHSYFASVRQFVPQLTRLRSN